MRWLILLLFVPFLSLGQSVHFKTITTRDGLSNNSINCIANHTDGSVWIGTWYGLNLYDGKQIKVFKHNPLDKSSVGGNDIYSLLWDKQDRLWVLTDGKTVSLYQKDETFKNFSFKGIPQVLSVSKQGNILVQLDTKQWYEYDGENFVLASNKQVSEVKKYLVLDARKKSPQHADNALFLENIRKQYKELTINAVTTEENGDIWMGTKTSGVYLIRKEGQEYRIVEHHQVDPQNPFSLLSNEVMVLHHDLFGNIWVGTKDGGLSILPRINANVDYVYAHLTKQPHLPYETIRAIAIDQSEGKWLGYYTQGLYYQKNKHSAYVSYPIQKQRENADWKRIRSIYSDSHGAIWVGTYAGVVRIEGGKQEFFEEGITPNFQTNRTYAFAEDMNHYLWVGSWGGVSKYNSLTHSFESFVNQDKLSKYHIRHISILDNQLILSTEEHGVLFYNYRSGEINTLDQSKGLLGNSVFTTYADSFSGDLWVATLGGISVFDTDNKLKKQIKEENGLPSHLIYSLIPYRGDIWISTTKGIASIDKKTYNVLNFSNYIGWQGLEFSEGAYSQNKNGYLYYGGNKGLNIIDPSQINNYDEAPQFKVIINGKSLSNDQVNRFKPEDNKIQLALYPIGFNQYPINQFEYRIVGLFDDWRALPLKEVNLDDLDHKFYKIEVRDTVDNEQKVIYTLSFEIQKPYFLQPYFIIGFVGVLGLLIFWRIRIKQKAIRKKEIELKKQVRDRTKEVEAQKTDLASKNVELNLLNEEIKQQREELLALHSRLKHGDIEMENFRIFFLSKIKKPIVNTLSTLEELNVDASKKEELVKVYDLVREWDYIEQVNDFDSGELVSVDLSVFIEYLREEWSTVREKFGITLNIENDLTSKWVEVDLLRIKLLLRYLLFECCKYMDANQVVNVRFSMRENLISIDIQSDSKTLLTFWNDNRSFSPYYRAFDSLLQILKGTIEGNEIDTFHLGLTIPVLCYSNEGKQDKETDWNEFLEELQVLPKDKMNILVYSKEEDKPIVKQLIGFNQEANIVYNHTVSRVVGNIEHYKYDALVLYNTSLSDRSLSLFSQIKKYAQKQRLIIFYIAEEVDYFLQEQLSQLGVSDFIHLPVSKSTLENKIYKRIRYDKENKESNTVLWKTNLSEDIAAHLSPNEKLFRKGMEIMNAQFSDAGFGIEQLTSDLGISKMKCYRLFKEFLDQSPLEILIEMRL
ncbi:MAG: ligand-binding sensor domain-containing protein, partial [Flavobacterium sp.]